MIPGIIIALYILRSGTEVNVTMVKIGLPKVTDLWREGYGDGLGLLKERYSTEHRERAASVAGVILDHIVNKTELLERESG